MRQFDRKFGADLLRELPAEPAVYLFKDEAGEVLYAGKAKDIRRRLASYRNAGRRRAHRKMRTLVRVAASLEVRLQPSERQALLVENELIRTLRPHYNVDGAYDFLYPAIGVSGEDGVVLLAFTTEPEAWSALGLAWYGSFRSRLRAREAFDALAELLAYLGHLEPRSRLPKVPRRRGSRLVALRRLPESVAPALHAFLGGGSRDLLPLLATLLLERPQARSEASEVQEALRTLDRFGRDDVRRLREALHATGRAGFVHRSERDALFIAARHR
jgi:predicted GIY-YIG superfamily endonuclease